MLRASIPRLTATRRELDTSSECFGELESSAHLLGDADALQRKMDEEGYLYMPGLLNRDEVMAARLHTAQLLADEGHLDPRFPVIDMVARPDADLAFRPDLAEHNPPLERVVYDGPLMAFFAHFLGGPVRHFDFTWLRVVAPGRGTPPHMDVVYMGRGTPRLYTAWVPYGDVPLETGGLLVLERSHRHRQLNATYGSKDVDAFCENRVGKGYTGMGGGGNISRGGWLSKDAVKLRRRLGGRWLTADFKAGDALIFSVFTVHTSLDNHSNTIRLSSDTRYQLASEPVDERWVGEKPIGHGPEGKKGMIC
jgi:hypothetical protein